MGMAGHCEIQIKGHLKGRKPTTQDDGERICDENDRGIRCKDHIDSLSK